MFIIVNHLSKFIFSGYQPLSIITLSLKCPFLRNDAKVAFTGIDLHLRLLQIEENCSFFAIQL